MRRLSITIPLHQCYTKTVIVYLNFLFSKLQHRKYFSNSSLSPSAMERTASRQERKKNRLITYRSIRTERKGLTARGLVQRVHPVGRKPIEVHSGAISPRDEWQMRCRASELTKLTADEGSVTLTIRRDGAPPYFIHLR